MARIVTLLFVLSAWVASAAPVPKEFKQTDEQKIVGTWELIKQYSHGEEIKTNGTRWRFEAQGNAFIIEKSDVPVGYKLYVRETPTRIDWIVNDTYYSGVYRLEGDTLKVAIGVNWDVTRPAELKPGKNVSYCELKRIAPRDSRRCASRPFCS